MSDDFFTKLNSIKGTIAKHPDPDEAMEHIVCVLKSDRDILREFFNKIEDPKWISALDKYSFFNTPPARVVLPNNSIRYLTWPASKYLLRVADKDPDQVTRVLKNIQTDNASVINDILDIANIVDPKYALRLLPTINDALSSETFWISSKDTAQLCVKFLEANYKNEALKFAKVLYAPSSNSSSKRHYQTGRHWYSEGLKKLTPAFSILAPYEFLNLMCEWLTIAIDAKDFDIQDDEYDLSDSWRPAVESHEQNHDWDLASIFVGFVRDGFETAIENHTIKPQEAFSILSKYKYTIYRRINIHLINHFADFVPDLARETMLDAALFRDPHTKHEYAMLMGKRFSMLSSTEKCQWYEFVSEGPNMAAFDSFVELHCDEPPTPEDRQSRRDYWKFQRLHWIRDHLEGSKRIFYDEMYSKHGQPRLADMNSYMTVGDAHDESPMTVEELESIPFNDAVELICNWESDGIEKWESPTYEGLNRIFSKLLSQNKTEYSSHAEVLIDRPPLFVRTFLTQMTVAVQEQISIDFEQVYKLCEWVLNLPDATLPVVQLHSGALIDTDWQWVRSQISDLIREICKVNSDSESIYPEHPHRHRLANLLQLLITNPIDDSTDFNRDEADPRLYDYTTYALNSQQGHAMRALVAYARWVAIQHKSNVDGNDVVANGISLMPEVKDLIEWTLSDEKKSISNAAILGENIGILYWIDSSWLKSIADKLFDLDRTPHTQLYEFGWAAWNSFVCWVNPHKVYYELLADKYKSALEQSFTLDTIDMNSSHQPMLRLTEHLVLLYGRGDLQDDELVGKLMSESPAEMRMKAIEFVGQSISHDEPLPREVTDRFKSLWTQYWNNKGKSDAKSNTDAHLFGRWFASGQFDDAWALNQLVEYSNIVGIPEPDHSVAERMEAIVQVDTDACLAVLKNMVEGDTEGWHIHSWIDPAHAILKHGIQCDGNTRLLAEEIINKLGRLGHLDFGELLNPS